MSKEFVVEHQRVVVGKKPDRYLMAPAIVKIDEDQFLLARLNGLYCYSISHDNGESWADEVVIDDNVAWQPGSYGMGDLVELANGNVKVVYYTSDKDQAAWLEECELAPGE